MITQIKDLSNQTFGKLIVLKKSTKQNKHGGCYWTCKCSCGKIIEVGNTALLSGRRKMCSQCQQNIQKVNNHPRMYDISGTIYPYFTVISYHHSDNKKRSYWLCKCNCGTEFIARKDCIQQETIKSCGCIKSKGEFKIIQILIINNINFKKEYIFKDLKDIKPLRFDFAIFDNNNNLIKLIEYQGKQHYENNNFFNYSNNLKLHDQLKIEFCQKNNIPLLIIPYTDYDKININYLLDN